jgi:hypothetical protein
MKPFFLLLVFSLSLSITTFAHDEKETTATVLASNTPIKEGEIEKKPIATCATSSSVITGDDFTITVSCTVCLEDQMAANFAAAICASKKARQLIINLQ